MCAADVYFLRTARLGLRCWSADDVPLALSLWGNLQVTRFIGGPFSDEQIRHRLEKEIASMSTHNVQYWPMFLLADGDFIGCGGLRPYQPEEKIYELGIHLRPQFWGRGLAEEAGRALIHFALQSLGASALFAGHNPANAASRKLLGKLGFHYTHEELYPPTGQMHPSYLLARP
jgi:[ribosomal protein S5]-alanine N-acetyltransferase